MALEDTYKLGLLFRLIDQFSRPSTEAVNKMEAMRKSAERLKQTSQSIMRVGVGLSAAGALITGAFLAPAFGTMELSKGLAEVSTLVDTTTFDMEKLKKAALRLGPALGQDIGTVVAASYNIISAGISDVNDVIMVLEQSGKAAVAGVTDLNTAASTGLLIINSYGKNVSELNKINDMLFETVRAGVTTFPELAANLGNVVSIANAAKVPLEQVLSSIAMMTKGGIATSQATTALRGLIQAISAPTPEAAKRLEEIGGAELKIAVASGDLIGAIRILRPHMKSLADIRFLIPEVKGAKAVATLIANFEEFEALNKTIRTSTGTTNEAFKKMADDASFKWAQMKAASSAFFRTIGFVGLPVLSKFFSFMTKGIIKLREFTERHQTLTKIVILGGIGFGLFLTAAGMVLTFLGTLGFMIANATIFLTTFGLTWGAVGVAVLGILAPIGLVILAIAGIAVAAYFIYKYWEPIKAFFSNLWTNITAGARQAWSDLNANFIIPISNAPSQITAWLTQIDQTITAFFAKLDLTQEGMNLINSFLNGIKAKAQELYDGIAGIAGRAMNLLPWNSPSKEGPFRYLDRVKIIETVAATLKAAPLISKLQSILTQAAALGTTIPLGLQPSFAGFGTPGAAAGTPALGGGGLMGGGLTINIGAINISAGNIQNTREIARKVGEESSQEIDKALRRKFKI